jgi:hypothetical protein
MSCEHDCARPAVFPRTIANRPGLDTIAYSIGDYEAMRAHMLACIDVAPELAAWTHRLADDPGIALVESTAVVGDILAFYQDLYANEAYLRTAKWRESVSDLVRVLGYRLAPGLGARARFALAAKGERTVSIPAGFAISVELPGAPKPANFEATAALEAVPALSKFHLYRPRFVPSIENGADTFQLDPGNQIELAAGERLLVGTASGRTLTHTQVLVVAETWEAFGVRHVRTEGRISSLLEAARARAVRRSAVLAPMPVLAIFRPVPTIFGSRSPAATLPAFAGFLDAGLALAELSSVPQLRAYKIGVSARHFGHDALPTRVVVDRTGHASELPVPYLRSLAADQGAPAGPQLRPRQLPLEREADDFAAGTRVLVEANLSGAADGRGARKRVLERAVSQVDRQSLAWGSLTGASTVLQLDEDLAIDEGGATLGYADVRGITVHQVEGDGFRLRAAPRPTSARAGSALDYYGRREEAAALAGRKVLLEMPGGLLAANVLAVNTAGDGAEPRFFQATLDRELDYTLFEHEAPRVNVYANLLETTEGKSEAEVALGDGDARAAFQTFALPKAPLTYLLDTASTPPQLPELEVWVDRVRWTRVESFFDRGPRETIYVVREGNDGKSFIQFGDGRTGARLPSGRGNVVARYRTGSGARGLPAPDKKPSAQRKPPGFDELWMLEPAAGGAAPESAANARLAAPASMQSLGRIVSLADYEAEALALPGVLKARAAWSMLDGASLVAITVLGASAGATEAAAIDSALRRALAARGPARCPLRIRIGERRRIRVRLTIAHEEARRSADIGDAIADALGVEDDDPADDRDSGSRGLMHWRMRTFGESVHGSQIVAAAQNVRGVVWARLDRLQGERAAPHQLLSLARADLAIDFVAAASDQGPP